MNNQKRLTAEVFYRELVNKTLSSELGEYQKSKTWTRTMLEKVIKSILQNYSLKTEKEYFRIDMIGWTQKKTQLHNKCKKVNLNSHLWDLQAAVEHENNSKAWLDEVCKLAYIRCPLRIVIGYGTENAEDKLSIANEILKDTKAFTDSDQEFAIILGERTDNFGKAKNNPCGFHCWVSTKTKEFTEIICQ